MFRDQPIIGAVVAFAAGAAIAAALPRTRQEDEMLGEAADQLRREAEHRAHQALEQGREAVSSQLSGIKEQAAGIYEQTKETVRTNYSGIKEQALNAAGGASGSGSEEELVVIEKDELENLEEAADMKASGVRSTSAKSGGAGSRSGSSSSKL
jgi:ElaB/YqjD/DUF883 family membrane-anchored ribosome-binding protein